MNSLSRTPVRSQAATVTRRCDVRPDAANLVSVTGNAIDDEQW